MSESNPVCISGAYFKDDRIESVSIRVSRSGFGHEYKFLRVGMVSGDVIEVRCENLEEAKRQLVECMSEDE